ncbi:Remorin family protein [Striga hermonthica]|uniref:Remorin family protein n=1 Tax=Striga hermonthica TaxID=68872 RepID=A0A9N7RC92_STRHE|nr:Remorin family protein [Striga hermonthica]
MSQEYDYDTEIDEYSTAVAAAAYAVRSLHNRTSNGPIKPSNKMRPQTVNNEFQPAPRKATFKLPKETSKQSSQDHDKEKMHVNKTSPYYTDESSSIKSSNSEFEKLGRPQTSVDENLNTNDDEKSPETPLAKTERTPIFETATRQSKTRQLGPNESMANAWEKEEMASIKERFVRLRATIDNWEIKKKRNADQKLERRQAEPDSNRGKAEKSHWNAIKRIEEIAGEARARAEANREKEERKVKEKSDKIRLTGKLPASCFCF